MPNTTYTDAQLTALEALKDPGFTLGIARAELANHALRADGTVTDDLAPVLAAATRHMAPREFQPFDSAEAFIMAHVAQERFLFVLDERDVPLIYFQCAVPGNPDLPPRKSAPRKTAAKREGN